MQRLLDQSIRQRWDTECSHPALGLGDVHSAYWRGHVAPCQQLGFDGRPVLFKVVFELGYAYAIYSGTSLVLDYPLIRKQHVGPLTYAIHDILLL
jgi:hypothetical protein